MAGAVEVQVAREELFEFRSHEESVGEGACHTAAAAASSPVESAPEARQESATGEDEAPPCLTGPTALPQELGPVDDGRCPAITVERHSRLAPYKPGKMTVVLDMDECLLHSKFHGPGAASEAYRQAEERPDSVNEVNSFWVALDDGDTAQVRLKAIGKKKSVEPDHQRSGSRTAALPPNTSTSLKGSCCTSSISLRQYRPLLRSSPIVPR